MDGVDLFAGLGENFKVLSAGSESEGVWLAEQPIDLHELLLQSVVSSEEWERLSLIGVDTLNFPGAAANALAEIAPLRTLLWLEWHSFVPISFQLSFHLLSGPDRTAYLCVCREGHRFSALAMFKGAHVSAYISWATQRIIATNGSCCGLTLMGSLPTAVEIHRSELIDRDLLSSAFLEWMDWSTAAGFSPWCDLSDEIADLQVGFTASRLRELGDETKEMAASGAGHPDDRRQKIGSASSRSDLMLVYLEAVCQSVEQRSVVQVPCTSEPGPGTPQEPNKERSSAEYGFASPRRLGSPVLAILAMNQSAWPRVAFRRVAQIQDALGSGRDWAPRFWADDIVIRILRSQVIGEGISRKVFDCADCIDGKGTRSVMADHPEGRAPVVPDIYNLRSQGYLDPSYLAFLINLNEEEMHSTLRKIPLDMHASGPDEAQYEHAAEYLRESTEAIVRSGTLDTGSIPSTVQTMLWSIQWNEMHGKQ